MNQDQTQDQNMNQDGEELPVEKFLDYLAQFKVYSEQLQDLFKKTKEDLSVKRKETLINTSIDQENFPWPGKMTHFAVRDPMSGALLSVSTNLQLTYVPKQGLGIVFTFDMLLPFFSGAYVPKPYKVTEEQKKQFNAAMPDAENTVKQGIKDLLRSHITSAFPGEGHVKATVTQIGAQENYTNSFGEFMQAATFISGTCVFFSDLKKEEQEASKTILQEGARHLLLESITKMPPSVNVDLPPSETKH